MNIASGDIYTNKFWREYYDVDREIILSNGKKRSNKVVVGSVIGALVDMDRGIINFFKDGKDLGQAFCSEDLKKGLLFPFF